MICPKCGTENRSANKLCFHCGASLVQTAAPVQNNLAPSNNAPVYIRNEDSALSMQAEPVRMDVPSEGKSKPKGLFSRLFKKKEEEYDYDEYDYDEYEDYEMESPQRPSPQPIVVHPMQSELPLVKETQPVETQPEALPVYLQEQTPEVLKVMQDEPLDELVVESFEETQPAPENMESAQTELPFVEDVQDWTTTEAENITTKDGFTTLIGMEEIGETMPKKVYRRRMSMSYMTEEEFSKPNVQNTGMGSAGTEAEERGIEEFVNPAVPEENFNTQAVQNAENNAFDEEIPMAQKIEQDTGLSSENVPSLQTAVVSVKEEKQTAESAAVHIESDQKSSMRAPASMQQPSHTSKPIAVYNESGVRVTHVKLPLEEALLAQKIPNSSKTEDEKRKHDEEMGRTTRYIPIRKRGRQPEPSVFAMPLEKENEPVPPKPAEPVPMVENTSKKRMSSILSAIETDKDVSLESRQNYEERVYASSRMMEDKHMEETLSRMAKRRRPVYEGVEAKKEMEEDSRKTVASKPENEPSYPEKTSRSMANFRNTKREVPQERPAVQKRTVRVSEKENDAKERKTSSARIQREEKTQYAVNLAYEKDAAKRTARRQEPALHQEPARKSERRPATDDRSLVQDWMEPDVKRKPRTVQRENVTDIYAGTATLARDKKPTTRRRRRRIKDPKRAILVLTLTAIILIALCTGLFFAVRGIVRGVSKAMDDKKQEEMEAMRPLVEVTTLNGNPAHKLTFKGSEGELIYITELKRTFPITNDQAIVTLDDAQWISSHIDVGNQVEVTLHPILYSKSGKQTEMPEVTFTVNVPTSPLAILAPQDGRAEVNSSFYSISIQVTPGSKVAIAGQDVSDLQDNEGKISYNVPIEAVGDNPIPIEVSTTGYATNHDSVIIHRPFMTIATEFSNTEGEVVKEKSVTLKGKTQPGVQLSLDTHPDVHVTLNEDGTFSFKAFFNKYGENIFTLRVKKEGVEDTVLSTSVYYSPSADTYTRAAMKFNYDTAANYTGKMTCFEVKGTITEVLSEEEPYTFLMNVGTEDAPKIVKIEMVSKNSYPQKGNKYRIFADVKEVGADNVPVMIGRYWYDPE